MRLEGRRKRANAAREAWNQLTLDVGEQQRRAKLLEDLERNLEGFAQSVKQVMKEAGRGMLAGICGPVTQLLKTPREYAVALETALGAAMQNVVWLLYTSDVYKRQIRDKRQRYMALAQRGLADLERTCKELDEPLEESALGAEERESV